MATEPKTQDPMIAALLRERDGYVAQNKPERIAQVDEQLAVRGYEPPQPEKAPEQPKADPKTAAPKGRTPSAPQQRT